MWRKVMRAARFRHVILSGLFFVVAGSSLAHAQTGKMPGQAIDYQKHGIKFQIKASIKSAVTPPEPRREDDRNVGTLAVKLRISAHAIGSNYFGEITEIFSNFKLFQGSDEKLYWQDEVCHQQRGFPKITVTAIDGTISGEKADVTISARPRHIGKLVPDDEISAGTRLPAGSDKYGNFIAYRSDTRQSRLFVNVKVYLIDCNLTGVGQSAPSERR